MKRQHPEEVMKNNCGLRAAPCVRLIETAVLAISLQIGCYVKEAVDLRESVPVAVSESPKKNIENGGENEDADILKKKERVTQLLSSLPTTIPTPNGNATLTIHGTQEDWRDAVHVFIMIGNIHPDGIGIQALLGDDAFREIQDRYNRVLTQFTDEDDKEHESIIRYLVKEHGIKNVGYEGTSVEIQHSIQKDIVILREVLDLLLEIESEVDEYQQSDIRDLTPAQVAVLQNERRLRTIFDNLYGDLRKCIPAIINISLTEEIRLVFTEHQRQLDAARNEVTTAMEAIRNRKPMQLDTRKIRNERESAAFQWAFEQAAENNQPATIGIWGSNHLHTSPPVLEQWNAKNPDQKTVLVTVWSPSTLAGHQAIEDQGKEIKALNSK